MMCEEEEEGSTVASSVQYTVEPAPQLRGAGRPPPINPELAYQQIDSEDDETAGSAPPLSDSAHYAAGIAALEVRCTLRAVAQSCSRRNSSCLSAYSPASQ